MKIASFNINGIRAIVKKETDLNSFVSKYDPDILCLQEIRADYKTTIKCLDSLKESYPYISVNESKTKKGYSGTAILSKIKPFPNPVFPPFPLPEGNDEGRVLTLDFGKFIVCNVYTPNSGAKLARLEFRTSTWDEAFSDYIDALRSGYPSKPLVILGDLNVAHCEIDLFNPKSNKNTAGFTDDERGSFSNMIVKNNLVDTFRYINPTVVKYTYWSNFYQARQKNRGWRIDYALVPKAFIKNVKSSDILDDVFGSDHCPIIIDIKV